MCHASKPPPRKILCASTMTCSRLSSVWVSPPLLKNAIKWVQTYFDSLHFEPLSFPKCCYHNACRRSQTMKMWALMGLELQTVGGSHTPLFSLSSVEDLFDDFNYVCVVMICDAMWSGICVLFKGESLLVFDWFEGQFGYVYLPTVTNGYLCFGSQLICYGIINK